MKMFKDGYVYRSKGVLYIVKSLPETGRLIFIRTKSEKDTYTLESVAENCNLSGCDDMPIGEVIFENANRDEWQRYKTFIRNLSSDDCKELVQGMISRNEWGLYDSVYPEELLKKSGF